MATKLEVIRIIATRKGLTVRKNVFVGGWCIGLPNGEHYNAKDFDDMVSFVRGY